MVGVSEWWVVGGARVEGVCGKGEISIDGEGGRG